MKRNGFTLLEMLVALVLGALLLAALSPVLEITVTRYQRASNSDLLGNERTFQDYMHILAERMRPTLDETAAPSCNATTIRSPSTLPWSVGAGQVGTVEIGVVPTNGRQRIRVTYRGDGTTSDELLPGAHTRIQLSCAPESIDGIYRLAWFSVDRSEVEVLPSPSIYVPKVTSIDNCELDPLTQRCRTS